MLREGPKKALFTVIIAFAGLVSIETFARVGLWLADVSYEEIRIFNHRWQSATRSGYYAKYEGGYPYLPYRVRPKPSSSRYSNPRGYRGRDFEWKKPEGTVRIACLGGSTTWEGTYPTVLQASLNESASEDLENLVYEVLNFGAESWTSVESLINYAVRGRHAELDAIVIYHAVNDVVAATHPAEIEPEPDYSHWRTRLKEPPTSWVSRVPAWADRSRAVGLVRRFFYGRQTADTWSTAMRHYRFEPEQPFQGSTTFRRNLEGIVSMALADGTSVFLVTQIHSPDFSRQSCGGIDGCVDRLHEMNQVVRELAAAYEGSGSVHLIDAAAEAERLGLHREMTDWCHFTKTGYERLGEFIGTLIRTRLRLADGRREPLHPMATRMAKSGATPLPWTAER